MNIYSFSFKETEQVSSQHSGSCFCWAFLAFCGSRFEVYFSFDFRIYYGKKNALNYVWRFIIASAFIWCLIQNWKRKINYFFFEAKLSATGLWFYFEINQETFPSTVLTDSVQLLKLKFSSQIWKHVVSWISMASLTNRLFHARPLMRVSRDYILSEVEGKQKTRWKLTMP